MVRISDLIQELEERLSRFGDIEVAFAKYDGDPKSSDLQPVENVSVECPFTEKFVVLWDK